MERLRGERERGTSGAAGERPGLPAMLGESAAWTAVREVLPRVARSGLPVLVLGETGTGKELVARAIHRLSERAERVFVPQNCGATPDTLIESELFGHSRGAFTGAVADRAGLFESAAGGTLFLDEIGDASALLQMKLLRVLQEGEARRVGDTRLRRVDVRVVSATHRCLEEAVSSGGFRSDLFFRLNAVRLRLPPLRERGDDVLLLARHFLAGAAAQLGQEPPEPGAGAGGAPARLPVAGERARAGERLRLRGAGGRCAWPGGPGALARDARAARGRGHAGGGPDCTPRPARSRSAGCARPSCARAGTSRRPPGRSASRGRGC